MEQAIEDLISKNADEFEISKLFKEAIREYFNSLDKTFKDSAGKDFLVKHTKSIDSFIELIYKYSLRKNFQDFQPMTNSIPITLIALGSYAREQLTLYSDIDLMIVYKDIEGFNSRLIIEKILYTIWDSNLKLGHRVHEISELESVVNEDITIKTALIESRFICGSKFLWYQVQNSLKKIRKHNQREFIVEKLNEYRKRRDNYPVSMEVYIKEGEGGLRDANTLFWIANIVYGVNSLKELVGELFSDLEYREYRVALEFIFRVRTALHIVRGKKQDRLILEYIVDIADKLGFEDSATIPKERALVSKTLNSIWKISTLSDIFLNRLTKKYLFKSENISKLREVRVDRNIYLFENMLFSSMHYKIDSINTLFKIFISLDDRDFKIDSSFLNAIKDIEDFRGRSFNLKEFFNREYISNILFALFRVNLLNRVIPELKKILYLAQFDGYHTYSVDIHTFKALENLESIKSDYILSIYSDLTKQDRTLLRVALLFHDSGKGRKSEHSIVGERLFRVFAKRVGFKESFIEDGAVLIRYHTLMSQVAQNEDIYSERVIISFVSHLKSKRLLDMLYILTYCDIRAVGEGIYSNFIDKLLYELYLNSLDALDKESLIKESARRVRKENSLKRYDKFNSLKEPLKRKILQIESNLFFLKLTRDEIIDVSKRAYRLNSFDIKIDNSKNLIVEIVKFEDLNLGYLLGKLSFLDVAQMDIFKLFNGKKYFKIEFHKDIDDLEINYLKSIAESSFDMQKSIKLSKPKILKDEIEFDLEHSKDLAKIEIHSQNQKGLLAYISKIFDDLKIDILTAKVTTHKNRVKDIFLVQKSLDLNLKIEKFLNYVLE